MRAFSRVEFPAARGLSVAGLDAAPGERASGMVEVDLGGVCVSIPLVLVCGRRPGPRVAVTAGVHGAEYVSIAALRQVAMNLDPDRVVGSLVAVLISNPAAFASRSIYVNPLDGLNLNRVFPGDPAGGPSERLAAWLFQTVIAPSDRYLDLHCGDMNEALVPFTGLEATGDPAIDDIALAMALAYGLDYVVFGPLPGSTTTAAAAAGIPSVLAEVGGQGRWPVADVRRHADGLWRALAAAGLLPGVDSRPERPSQRLTRDVWLRADVGGCFHPAVDVGQAVRAGQVIGEIQDAFGVVLRTIEAPIDGVVLFLVTSLAMNAGDPLLAIGV